jgi:hypothetical protein
VLGGQFAQCAQAQPAQNLRSKSDNLAAGYKSMNNQVWNAVLLCFVLLIALATVAAIRRGACCPICSTIGTLWRALRATGQYCTLNRLQVQIRSVGVCQQRQQLPS